MAIMFETYSECNYNIDLLIINYHLYFDNVWPVFKSYSQMYLLCLLITTLGLSVAFVFYWYSKCIRRLMDVFHVYSICILTIFISELDRNPVYRFTAEISKNSNSLLSRYSKVAPLHPFFLFWYTYIKIKKGCVQPKGYLNFI